jgi:acyl carrier protein
MKSPMKAAPRPIDPRVPARVREALVSVSGCDDVEVRLETPLAMLPSFEVGPDSLDVFELVIKLEDLYACDLIAWEDAIEATWPTGTVLTVIDTLHKAGVAL